MYCPKCGVHNLEDAKFCRACGADIRLVPQALTGHLPEGAFGVDEVEELEEKGRKERKYKFKKPPTLEKGLENVFCGLAFIIIFLLGFFYMRGLFMVWVWAIIPAMTCIGEGIGQIIRARSAQHALPPADTFRPASPLPHAPARELPAADTSEIKRPPASVTENTTRHLAAPRKPTAGDA
ncbi:MAG TPA: zinc-ribbon domain-containing protein [Pyrinomonadaceae bacterium]|nr:zinc-ribbon domain-containing protein [Pyrinomonadaceae bacterium]